MNAGPFNLGDTMTVKNASPLARTLLGHQPKLGNLQDTLKWLVGLNLKTLYAFTVRFVSPVGVISDPFDLDWVVKSNVNVQFNFGGNFSDQYASMILCDKVGRPILLTKLEGETLTIYYKETVNLGFLERGQYYYQGRSSGFRRTWDGRSFDPGVQRRQA